MPERVSDQGRKAQQSDGGPCPHEAIEPELTAARSLSRSNRRLKRFFTCTSHLAKNCFGTKFATRITVLEMTLRYHQTATHLAQRADRELEGCQTSA